MSSEAITKNDLENILNEVLPPKETDTGWIRVTPTSQFVLYSAGSYCEYRKVNNVVNIHGEVKPTSNITGSTTDIPILTVPEGFRPAIDLITLHQGSGNAMWATRLRINGELCFERYRDTASASGAFVTVDTSTWLPFNITFITD